MWMNQDDVEDVVYLLDELIPNRSDEHYPNLLKGAQILRRLVRWTNRNSDGWHSWPKPGKASEKLQEVLSGVRQRYIRDDLTDLTDAELRKLLTPIKRFLTTRDVEHSLILED